jgi:hypothetical protein
MRLPESGQPKITSLGFVSENSEDEEIRKMLTNEQKETLIEILNEHICIKDSSFAHESRPSYEKRGCDWIVFELLTDGNYVIVSKQDGSLGRYAPNTGMRDIPGAS